MKSEKHSPEPVNCTRRSALGKVLLGSAALIASPSPLPARDSQPTRKTYWGEGVEPDVVVYVRSYYDFARGLQHALRIPVWASLAVAIHESDAGKSELAKFANNHFGIKGRRNDWNGALYCKDEGRDPQTNEVLCEYYRHYDSVKNCYQDFGRFLQAPRYDKLRSQGAYDYYYWVQALKDGGYAEDEDYVGKVLGHVLRHRLYELNYLEPEPIKRA